MFATDTADGAGSGPAEVQFTHTLDKPPVATSMKSACDSHTEDAHACNPALVAPTPNENTPEESNGTSSVVDSASVPAWNSTPTQRTETPIATFRSAVASELESTPIGREMALRSQPATRMLRTSV